MDAHPVQVLDGHAFDGRADPELCRVGHCRRLYRRFQRRGGDRGATEIGQQEFQRLYQNFVRNQGQQMGMDITPDMAQKMGLPQVALQQLLSRTALDNEADRLGLTTPDTDLAQYVRGMSAFRGPLGTFDRPTFIQAITNAHYTEDQFLAEVRQEMTRDQLGAAVEANFIVPPTYAQALFSYINEKRAADYVILSPDQAGDVAPPSDAILAAYVKAHPERYSTPEYRDADYAAIMPADVMASVSVSDAQIAQEYNAHKATYVIPEKRDIQQIEFKTQKEAVDARAGIDKGMSFDELATRRGLKPEQISLGTLTQAELPDADRAKVIFALPENQVSQPLTGAFGGYVLARVTKITPGSNKTLADVKDDIKKALTTALAANKLVDAVNAYTDARSSGSDLKEGAARIRHETRPSGCGGRDRPEARRHQGRRAGRSGISARHLQDRNGRGQRSLPHQEPAIILWCM